MTTKFKCTVCKEKKEHNSTTSTGYGLDKNNKKVCFACCEKQDKKTLLNLKKNEKFVLYYDQNIISNWPSTLQIKPYYTSIGAHNWGLKRYNTWFKLDNKNFYGYTIGNNTQIHHIRKIKS